MPGDVKKKAPHDELIFNYRFIFSNGKKKTFNIRLNKNSLDIIRPKSVIPPEWTKLRNFKCSHCPLSENKYEYCPLAVNLSDVIGSFSNLASFEKAEMIVDTGIRQFRKSTSVQAGVSSLLGVLMVASSCPVMGKLKPMMRFHLPFASMEETEYRVLSMYLLAQFFLWKKGKEPDWEMKNLVDIYSDIKILNRNVCKKISKIETKDANRNAVVILNNFAEHVTFILNKKILHNVELLFKDYF
jgi:hypothetical protein